MNVLRSGITGRGQTLKSESGCHPHCLKTNYIYRYEYSLYAPLLGYPSTDAAMAIDLDDLRTNEDMNAWYDDAGGWLYLQPILPVSPFHPGGTSIFDGGMVFFLVIN